MKVISTLLFIVISLTASSQSCMQNEESGIAVGLSGGYASNQRVTGNYSLGGQVHTRLFSGQEHFSVNLQVFGNSSNVGTPVIVEGRLGHVFNNSLEVYGGYAYHRAKTDAAGNKASQLISGFKPAYGIMKRFNHSWWTVSAGVSGDIFSVQLGLLVIR